MMETPKYKRVLLKISGEALAGDSHSGLDFPTLHREPRWASWWGAETSGGA